MGKLQKKSVAYDNEMPDLLEHLNECEQELEVLRSKTNQKNNYEKDMMDLKNSLRKRRKKAIIQTICFLLLSISLCTYFYCKLEYYDSTNQTLKYKNGSLEREVSLLESENISLREEREDLENENVSLKGANEDLENENISLKGAKEDLENENISLKGAKEDLENENISLKEEKKDLENGNSTLSAQVELLQNQYKAIQPEFEFYHTYAVIVGSDRRLYHQFGCKNLDTSRFTIHNIKAAQEEDSFSACSICNK